MTGRLTHQAVVFPACAEDVDSHLCSAVSPSSFRERKAQQQMKETRAHVGDKSVMSHEAGNDLKQSLTLHLGVLV